ncbi:hypothetical protein Bca4012_084187 [Brassica carinata]
MSNSSKVIAGGCGGARKANNGMNDIPSRSRQIVQSLKEVANSPETEIYAMLKECNMDPNEAVHRILSQGSSFFLLMVACLVPDLQFHYYSYFDPFHEVKSRKEKKKETRDMPDSRPRGANNTYNRGGRGGSDRYAGRSASTHLSSTGKIYEQERKWNSGLHKFHELTGSKVTLKKPLLVLKKLQKCTGGSSEKETELEVIEIIRNKLGCKCKVICLL